MRFKKGNLKKKNNVEKAFTLIELLAVIIILGILMIIAVPSVTEYIQTSRREGYVRTATQYINGAITKVNSAKLPMFDVEATYYYPAKCITLEKGGDSPFGELKEAYIVITYDGTKYDYYWTSRDETNTGILLTADHLLHESKVKSNITSISTDIGIEGKTKILLIKDCDGYDIEEIEPVETIPVDGELVDNSNTDFPGADDDVLGDSLYSKIMKDSIIDNVSSKYVINETGIDFSKSPSDTNGKGVYIRAGTENDSYPIYYYRGLVDNNNIIFANFCWKIVRTTDTGGIKLIYNGVPINGTCNNTGANSQIGETSFNSNSSPADAGYMYGRSDRYKSVRSFYEIGYLFGNDVVYENGVYKLKDVYVSNDEWKNIYSTVKKNYHYTCFSTEDTCSEVYYIYYANSSTSYLTSFLLTSGEKIEDLLNELVVSPDNINDSNVKRYIDNWYSSNMTSYTSYLEDTIWCNDRSIYYKGSFDKNTTSNSYPMLFEARNRLLSTYNPSVYCSRKIDSFTVDDTVKGNGGLTYPVALLTGDEYVLAGYSWPQAKNGNSYIYNGYNLWSLSPSQFVGDDLMERGEFSYLDYDYLFVSMGVRPSVSLKNNTVVSGGDGTANSPYIVG